MHPRIKAQRELSATNTITEAATQIALNLGVDPSLVEGVVSPPARTREVRDLNRMEAIAELLQAVSEKTGSEKIDTSSLTIEEVHSKVDSGEWDAKAALASEETGKQRVTLMEWLSEQDEGDD